jgi:hypothetical protein
MFQRCLLPPSSGRSSTSTRLHGTTSQKTAIFLSQIVRPRTSHFTKIAGYSLDYKVQFPHKYRIFSLPTIIFTDIKWLKHEPDHFMQRTGIRRVLPPCSVYASLRHVDSCIKRIHNGDVLFTHMSVRPCISTLEQCCQQQNL